MNLYTNGFRCSANEDRSEVILHFIQNGPVSDSMENGPVAVQTDIVSQLVMSQETAQNLVYVLSKMLNIQQPDQE